jgi:thiamine-phosphate pyrophosphorylase
MIIDPFYPILDGAEWIERLVPLGVRTVQLRMKERPPQELREHIRASLSICRRHDCRLIVNDHWQLAIDEGCDFVHLGQEDLAAADRGAIRRAGLKLGVSTHDPAELETALAAGPDYVALGPVWPTLLKKMRWAPQGVARLREWRDRIGELALVAIGGITPERLPAIFAHGASAAAVVTDIVRAADPEARTSEWLAATAAITSRTRVAS